MEICRPVPFIPSSFQWVNVEWTSAIDGRRRRSSRLVELSADGLRARDGNYGNKRDCVLYDWTNGRFTPHVDDDGRGIVWGVWIVDQGIYQRALRPALTPPMQVDVEELDVSIVLPVLGMGTSSRVYLSNGSLFVIFQHDGHELALCILERFTEYPPEAGGKLHNAIYGQVRVSAELQRASTDAPFPIAARVDLDGDLLSATKLIFHGFAGVPPTSRDLNLPPRRENPSTEIELLSHLSGTCPAGLMYGLYFEACTRCCFVGMPLAAGEVLQQLDERRRNQAQVVVTFQQLKDYAVQCFRQIVPALRHLHDLHIAHLDLSLENVLFTANGRFYLTDFGHAREIGHDPTQVCMTTLFPRRNRKFHAPGKPTYYCPELYYPHLIHDHILRNNCAALELPETFICGYGVDCWQLGIMLYIMTVEMRPCHHEGRPINAMGMNEAVCDWLETIYRPWRYAGGFREHMLRRLYNQRIPIGNELVIEGMQAEVFPTEPPAQENQIVSPVLDVIQGLLNVRPNDRFTLDDIERSPWFNQMA